MADRDGETAGFLDDGVVAGEHQPYGAVVEQGEAALQGLVERRPGVQAVGEHAYRVVDVRGERAEVAFRRRDRCLCRPSVGDAPVQPCRDPVESGPLRLPVVAHTRTQIGEGGEAVGQVAPCPVQFGPGRGRQWTAVDGSYPRLGRRGLLQQRVGLDQQRVGPPSPGQRGDLGGGPDPLAAGLLDQGVGLADRPFQMVEAIFQIVQCPVGELDDGVDPPRRPILSLPGRPLRADALVQGAGGLVPQGAKFRLLGVPAGGEGLRQRDELLPGGVGRCLLLAQRVVECLLRKWEALDRGDARVRVLVHPVHDTQQVIGVCGGPVGLFRPRVRVGSGPGERDDAGDGRQEKGGLGDNLVVPGRLRPVSGVDRQGDDVRQGQLFRGGPERVRVGGRAAVPEIGHRLERADHLVRVRLQRPQDVGRLVRQHPRVQRLPDEPRGQAGEIRVVADPDRGERAGGPDPRRGQPEDTQRVVDPAAVRDASVPQDLGERLVPVGQHPRGDTGEELLAQDAGNVRLVERRHDPGRVRCRPGVDDGRHEFRGVHVGDEAVPQMGERGPGRVPDTVVLIEGVPEVLLEGGGLLLVNRVAGAPGERTFGVGAGSYRRLWQVRAGVLDGRGRSVDEDSPGVAGGGESWASVVGELAPGDEGLSGRCGPDGATGSGDCSAGRQCLGELGREPVHLVGTGVADDEGDRLVPPLRVGLDDRGELGGGDHPVTETHHTGFAVRKNQILPGYDGKAPRHVQTHRVVGQQGPGRPRRPAGVRRQHPLVALEGLFGLAEVDGRPSDDVDLEPGLGPEDTALGGLGPGRVTGDSRGPVRLLLEMIQVPPALRNPGLVRGVLSPPQPRGDDQQLTLDLGGAYRVGGRSGRAEKTTEPGEALLRGDPAQYQGFGPLGEHVQRRGGTGAELSQHPLVAVEIPVGLVEAVGRRPGHVHPEALLGDGDVAPGPPDPGRIVAGFADLDRRRVEQPQGSLGLFGGPAGPPQQ
nr:hypothetical protein Ade03nite_66510 [Actinoplanes derwentensis]